MGQDIGMEFDFLPVGDNSKNGDAIAIRYGTPGSYKTMIVDGGTKNSGENLVNHFREYYDTSYVDYVVNTHPDGDHASGLIKVLEELEVGELWMHLPWNHSNTISNLFKDGRITDNSLSERIKNSLNKAHELYELAKNKDVKVSEPFEGDKIGEFVIMSPNREWYINELLPNFEGMPEKKAESYSDLYNSLQEMDKTAFRKFANFIEETWDVETLKEDAKTTARNESSVVLYGELSSTEVLLTGDAGVQALNRTADYAERIGVNLINCSFVQVPHHGSRRNVSPSTLNRILGKKVSRDYSPRKSAYASVALKADDYPRRSVSNAFKRRGAKVFVTKGNTIRYSKNMPTREGWSNIEPLPFFNEVEE